MMLEALRSANPTLRLYSVFDPAFAPYGRVLSCEDPAALSAALDQTPIPETGNRYEASAEPLEALPAVRALEKTVYGGMPIQAGFCNGNGDRLNAEEYHKCSEINYSTTGLVLLLALQEDLRDWQLDAAGVIGFYLPPEVLIELHPRVLHFAPCRVSDAGFRCLVVLERGTNGPVGRPGPGAAGEERLLWMQNKWLLCHPDSPQAAKGAYVGIRGENLRLRLPRSDRPDPAGPRS
jgi:hypothetical protein